MSVINYTVQSTKEVKSIPEGNVAVRIARNDGKKGKSGLCILVPVVSESFVSLMLNDVNGRAFITDAIDELRSKVASALNVKRLAITSESLGISAILAECNKLQQAQRMTVETLGLWFDDVMMAPITARLIELNPAVSDAHIAKTIKSYKEQFQTLSGQNVSFSAGIKANLIKAVDLLPDETEHTVIGEKAIAALNASKVIEVELGAL